MTYVYIYITQENGSVIGQKFSGDFFFNGCVIQYSAVKFLTEKNNSKRWITKIMYFTYSTIILWSFKENSDDLPSNIGLLF